MRGTRISGPIFVGATGAVLGAVAIGASQSGLETKNLLEKIDEGAGINGTTSEVLVVDSDGCGRSEAGSRCEGLMGVELGIGCSKVYKLFLQRGKMGLIFQEEVLAFSVGLGKVCHFSAGSGVVDAGVSNSCLFIVQGLHVLGKEVTEDWPLVFNLRLGIPSTDLEGELGKEFHMVNICQDISVDVESILGIFKFFEFLHEIIFPTKVLIKGPASVVGGIKDSFGLDYVCGTKNRKASLNDLKNLQCSGLGDVVLIISRELEDYNIIIKSNLTSRSKLT